MRSFSFLYRTTDSITPAQIVHSTGALFLIDDSAENALDAAQATPPCRVLLFGAYPWNAIVHRPSDTRPEEKTTYLEKEQRGLLAESGARRREMVAEGWLPDGVERVRDWDEVVAWVEGFKE